MPPKAEPASSKDSTATREGEKTHRSVDLRGHVSREHSSLPLFLGSEQA